MFVPPTAPSDFSIRALKAFKKRHAFYAFFMAFRGLFGVFFYFVTFLTSIFGHLRSYREDNGKTSRKNAITSACYILKENTMVPNNNPLWVCRFINSFTPAAKSCKLWRVPLFKKCVGLSGTTRPPTAQKIYYNVRRKLAKYL